MKHRILSLIMALILSFSRAVNASASNTSPDLTMPGSLSFVMEYDNKPLTDGRMNMYYVGSIEKTVDATYDFAILDALGMDCLTEEQLNNPEIAASMLTKAKAALGETKRLSAPIENGSAVFADLATGLYLVWQEEADASTGMSPIRPFLISVPRWQGDSYALDVTGAPKVPIETEPTEPPPPPPPPPPELPQTGQLNWPIPVMALSGAILIIVGWILCASRKRCRYEK